MITLSSRGVSIVDETTGVATPSRGRRLRRAGSRAAVVLGFAVGGWLAVTGSASAGTTSLPAPPPASLSGGAIVGLASAPLPPVVSQVVGPVLPVVAAPVVDKVWAQVAGMVAPAVQTLSAALAPVDTTLTPLTSALGPVLGPVTDPLASGLTTDGPCVAVQDFLTAAVDSPPARPFTGTGVDARPLAERLPAQAASPGWGTTFGDLVSGDSTGPAPTTGTDLDRLTVPSDGPAAGGGSAPVSPAGAPCSGVPTSCPSGVGQLLGAAVDSAALPAFTLVSRAWSCDDAVLKALASEPGFSPA